MGKEKVGHFMLILGKMMSPPFLVCFVIQSFLEWFFKNLSFKIAMSGRRAGCLASGIWVVQGLPFVKLFSSPEPKAPGELIG